MEVSDLSLAGVADSFFDDVDAPVMPFPAVAPAAFNDCNANNHNVHTQLSCIAYVYECCLDFYK